MSEKRWIMPAHLAHSATTAAALCCLTLLSGCSPTDPEPVAQVTSAVSEEPAGLPEGFTMDFAGLPSKDDEAAQALHDAANRLWKARTTADYTTMYEFEKPDDRANVSLEDYLKWCETDLPFQWHSFELGDAYAHGYMGWVRVKQSVSIRRFASLPPRDTTVWEHWMKIDDVWMPVASAAAENFPTTPANRDIQAEGVLKDAFVESWRHRLKSDWSGLYKMLSAETRAQYTEQKFSTDQDNLVFVGCRAQWVEVVEDRGRVCGFVQYKFNDPSLRKMPAQEKLVTEQWVYEDGAWKLDLHDDTPAEQGEPTDG